VLNRVRQTVRTLTATSGRRFYQFALLAVIRPTVPGIGGDAVLTVAAVLAVVLVAIVALAVIALYSKKPFRRRNALAVLDRILRWKT
jgi:amino acid permease